MRELPADRTRGQDLVELVPRRLVFGGGFEEDDAASGFVDRADAASECGGCEYVGGCVFGDETDGGGGTEEAEA
eukprot:CAMPEP_0198269794 /NCGR_PEP_ID=MMETSP1447-20131203/42589_1 /TAXON_ID=420782 /ORGANISM="Chaetoceros dichaeta, Strain CCMP1751" /LENGTH=73 /DNA_ID=CAMNT_0043961521 /DNA_START=25 /DNA_END=246 /DNA_ORIENTATION=+